MSRPIVPLAERFWAKVTVAGPDDCWLWQGSAGSHGYGQVYVSGGRRHSKLAHVVAIELTAGPVPHGMQVDHLCRVRLCCNPRHLEVVTQRENLRREAAALLTQRTTCKRGHPRTPENARVRRGPDGLFRGFQCRPCLRQTERARRQATT